MHSQPFCKTFRKTLSFLHFLIKMRLHPCVLFCFKTETRRLQLVESSILFLNPNHCFLSRAYYKSEQFLEDLYRLEGCNLRI